MGCKSSKDGAQPTTKKIGKGKASAGSPERGGNAAKMQSPSKLQLKPIKEMSQSELEKHKKAIDILGFVKSGALPMVHGLIKHFNLGQAVLLVKGFGEEFHMTKTEKVSMAEWNPFLIAVAFKKLEIVRYFT